MNTLRILSFSTIWQWLSLLSLVAFLLLLAPLTAFLNATAGDLDLTFGEGGTVVTDFGGGEQAFAVALQNDGKMVVAGSTDPGGSRDFALARLSVDGLLDTTFGTGGQVVTDFGGGDEAHDIAIQSDGKIVAAGFTGNDIGLARYHPDGSLDMSFDGDGLVTTDLFDFHEEIYALTIQADDKIVVAGIGYTESAMIGILLRYLSDGTLDSSFGTDGLLMLPLEGAYDVVLQADGKLVVAGGGAGLADFALARVNPNGTLDSSFDDDGLVTTDFDNGSDSAYAVALQADGKLVAMGGHDNTIALARYHPDGTLDSTFDGDGKVIADVSSDIEYAGLAVVVQADDKVVTVGSLCCSEDGILVIRHNSDGSLDSSFGNGGYVVTGSGAAALDVALQADGKLVVVGQLQIGLGDFAIARYLNDLDGPLIAGPDLDPTFDGDGKVIVDVSTEGNNYDAAFAVVLQSDGKIVTAGTASNMSNSMDFALLRHNPDGSLDTTFGDNGKVLTDFFGISDDFAFDLAIQPDGKLVAAGFARPNSDNNSDFVVARYHPDGSLDQTFGNGGKVVTDLAGEFDEGRALALQEDGKIVMAGYTSNNINFGLVRYNTDGSLDTTFGTGGKVETTFADGNSFADALAIQPDGKIVAAGSAGGKIALARYEVDGTLDGSFGTSGLVTTTFSSSAWAWDVALLPDSRLVVAGTSGTSNRNFALARYNSDGSLDNTFASDGKVTTDFEEGEDVAYSLVLQTDGKVLAIGGASGANGSDFAVARYNTDGSLDETFGTGGKVTTDFAGLLDQAYAATFQADSKLVVVGMSEVDNGQQVSLENFALARYYDSGMTATPTPSPSITPPSTPTASDLPDLVVNSMSVTLETGGSCNFPSTELGLRVWFQNVGNADAGSFVVEVNGAQQAFSDGLAVGESDSLWFSGYDVGDNHAFVDATSQVTESNEENNELSQILPIPTLPPTCTPTTTLTPSSTLTVTPTPTSMPGPPQLSKPDDEATLPQPVAPDEWFFAWSARTGPCYSTIHINGPDGTVISENIIWQETGYVYHYSQDEAIPDNALGPWQWSVSVNCPLGSNQSKTRTFWVEPPTITPTPTPTASATLTFTPTASATLTTTATYTPAPQSTISPTPTSTLTPMPTAPPTLTLPATQKWYVWLPLIKR